MPEPTPWMLPDEKLLAACRVESFASSGPGGQNKNRSAAAVRITHLPTKIHAAATDSRSHRENQIHALRELRHKLAMELRREIADPVHYRPPAFFRSTRRCTSMQKTRFTPRRSRRCSMC